MYVFYRTSFSSLKKRDFNVTDDLAASAADVASIATTAMIPQLDVAVTTQLSK